MNPEVFTTWLLCSLACIVGGFIMLGALAKALTWTLDQVFLLGQTIGDLKRYWR